MDELKQKKNEDENNNGVTGPTLRSLWTSSTKMTPASIIPDFTMPSLVANYEELPLAISCFKNLSLNDDFNDLSYIATGSNSYVYTAKLKRSDEKVVVKMLREDVINDPIANEEFDKEFAILSRLDHPNIIKVMGSGNEPHKFIVLEYLSKGSLDIIQSNAKASLGYLQKRLLGRSAFQFADVIRMSIEIASAMNYLHNQVHPDVKIIHRDLKHDNIGFTSDGTLKIFDFGLCTSVVRGSNPNELYDMTGGTGTMRYMAPEVALRKPYSEKVDVYSFAIVVWQMAKGKIFKKKCTRSEFMRDVVSNGERPEVDKSWPREFSELLKRCWDTDPDSRPSFPQIMITLIRIAGHTYKHLDDTAPSSSLNSVRTEDSELTDCSIASLRESFQPG